MSDFEELVEMMKRSMTPVLRQMWRDVRHVPNAKLNFEEIVIEMLEKHPARSDIDFELLALPAVRRVVREFVETVQ